MQCPICDSQQTQRQRLVFESGTSSVKSESELSDKNRTFISTESTNQTRLAAKCSPPLAPDVGCAGIGCGSLILAVVLVALFNLKVNFFILVSIIGVAWVVLRVPGFRQEQKKFSERMYIYERSWICHRCGHTWWQEKSR